MYRLEIFENENLKCLVHGTIDDITFLIDNIRMKVTYRFKITTI